MANKYGFPNYIFCIKMASLQKNVLIPDKDVLREVYSSYRPHFNILLSRLDEFIQTSIKPKIAFPPSYKARVKSFESYYSKLLRLYSRCPEMVCAEKMDFPILTDMVGIRIICFFLQDLKEVGKIISDCFDVVEIEEKGSEFSYSDQFGYVSNHFILKVADKFTVGLELPDNMVFEIQVRTILQDAWAEVEHEIIYKSNFSLSDVSVKRKLVSINATLSLVDTIFQELRDYQSDYNVGLNKRRESFYSKADEHTEVLLGIRSTTESIVSTAPKSKDMSSYETIDKLILEVIEAHNSNDFARAEKIYSKIIAAKPNDVILSVMYKHRGMAFFAQSLYEAAYEDFKSSARYAPKNYRSYYYAGIALSLLHRDDEAIEEFSKALELSRYKAHVYFRRALSYYSLGYFIEALKDLDIAKKLGFNKEVDRKLRNAIAKKIDMV